MRARVVEHGAQVVLDDEVADEVERGDGHAGARDEPGDVAHALAVLDPPGGAAEVDEPGARVEREPGGRARPAAPAARRATASEPGDRPRHRAAQGRADPLDGPQVAVGLQRLVGPAGERVATGEAGDVRELDHRR